MDDFPIKLNDWINAFVAHNWLAVSILLAILAGLSAKLTGKAKIIIESVHGIFRDAWAVVRPRSNNQAKEK